MGLPPIQWACIAVAVLYAFRCGGRPEKIGAVIIAAASAIDRLWHFIVVDPTASTVESFLFSLDTVSLLAAYILALKADRIWTMPFASTFLLAVCAHVAMAIDVEMHPLVYAILIQGPFWLSVATVLIGTSTYVRYRRAAKRGGG
tara:strand:- start:234 stop:668 length:435 start_codon:yes stop_codon:yes gene_type:complete